MVLSSVQPEPREGELEPLWWTDSLPFTIGACAEPRNPGELPNALPFSLGLDTRRGLLVQLSDMRTRQALERAYRIGSLLGTPMDDTPLGRIYADDFMRYLTAIGSLSGRRVLEIGCGRGYLMRRMTDLGARVLGVEPGRENAPYWSKYGVEVINDYFPTVALQETFPLVICYGVLEHVENYGEFLGHVRRHLRDDGMLALAVPDERPYIQDGDPSTLVHEHFVYCTPSSLSRLVSSSGFAVRDLQEATHGGVIYCIATRSAAPAWSSANEAELAEARRFAVGCARIQRTIIGKVRAATKNKRTIGIYCPARGLATLPQTESFRFFDDDPELCGRYYPPFVIPIEPRAALLDHPVDELIIFSRTFGARLKKELTSEPRLARCSISAITELLAR